MATSTNVKDQQNSDSDSDAPVAVSLKAAKTKRLTQTKEIEKHISIAKKKKKDAVREIRARRHERNILQKKVKSTQKKKIEGMLLDSTVLKSAKALKMKLEKRNEDKEENGDGMDVQSDEEVDKSNLLDGSGVAGSDSDAESDTGNTILHKDPGVHVVSLTESSDFFLKKALEWKQQMLYGPSIPRMTYAEYKSMREKQEAADKRPKLEKLFHS
ncbi:hypothetical protein FHG87_006896 [Trinorchestia longiramus]|nr:hypothetical protein FHG87_006896 [Trinorchestia longiramus]